MFHNRAAWLLSKGAPLIISPSNTLIIPGVEEVVIQTRAIALQPGDWKLQNDDLPSTLTYPLIPGMSIAGTIVAVGAAVTRFQRGDRVLSCTGGSTLRNGDPRYGGFQNFVLSAQYMTAHIGDYSFATAATASSSLGNAFSAMVHHCGLVAPTPTRDIEKKAEKVLIWGGASSIGSFAIQIAAQGGYHVITTASIRHAKYLHSLGAAEVLDYYTLSRQELQTWLSANGPYFRIFTVAEDAVSQTIIGNVLWAQGGGEFITTNALREKTVLPRGVHARVVKLLDVYLKPEMREFAQWAYWSFIEKGLSAGTLKLGKTQLVEGGLRGLEEGLRTLQEGVNGVKLVVELWD